MEKGPDPHSPYPVQEYDKLVFLKHFIKAENIFIGDYTYYDDQRYGPEKFEEHNVLYNYDFSKMKLVIGKFCAIAAKTHFIMTGDHKLDAFTTYPFPIFGQGWEKAFNVADFEVKGDIIVGNDVWFGYDSMVKNGVTIGDGAIIAAKAVVVKDVPPYAIVAGNPGRVVKMRFDDHTIERLLNIAWWNWEIEKINAHLPTLCHLDLERLETAAQEG